MAVLELLLGPMRSNKTRELQRRVRMRQNFAHQHVPVFKPGEDVKSGRGVIESRNPSGRGATDVMDAFEIDSANPWVIFGVIAEQEKIIGKKIECIALDEGQFIEGLFPFTGELLKRGYDAIIAGLDLDFRAQPFGDTLALRWFVDAYGGSLTWCIAYCSCGKRGFFSQRLIEGKPADYNSPLKVPGDSYEPRCVEHFVLPNRPFPA